MKKKTKPGAASKLARQKAMAEERGEGKLKGKANRLHEGREKKKWESYENAAEGAEHGKR